MNKLAVTKYIRHYIKVTKTAHGSAIQKMIDKISTYKHINRQHIKTGILL